MHISWAMVYATMMVGPEQNICVLVKPTCVGVMGNLKTKKALGGCIWSIVPHTKAQPGQMRSQILAFGWKQLAKLQGLPSQSACTSIVESDADDAKF